MLSTDTTTTPPPIPDEEAYCWRAGAWAAYHRTRADHRSSGRVKEDQGAYMPDPDEIDLRIADMKRLVELGFPDELITAIMVEDCPSMDRVKAMILRHGAAGAVARCLEFWGGGT